MAGLLAVLLVGGTAAVYVLTREDPDPGVNPELVADVDACDVPVDLLERMWRGHYPGRSGDVIAIEQYPAIYGNRHATPWPYTQEVPLFLYGPGFIKPGASDRPVTVADLAPTFAELMDFDGLGRRDGRVLKEALLPPAQRKGTPRLLVTLVWDGIGDNVMDQWPDAWPELKELMAKGASYTDATVGSSPSITPTIHATIGTGNFPNKHGQPDTKIRVKNKLVDAWERFSPKHLESTTLADLWDVANRNEPKVGVFARDSWHGGMIGHGTLHPGGDADLGVFDDLGAVSFRTSQPYFYMPEYMKDTDGLDEAIQTADLVDGKDDDTWLGNALVPYSGQIRYGISWPSYQTAQMSELLTKEGFGQDDIADLFYVNYKSGDLAGHEWTIESPEMEAVVEEQDRQLPDIIAMLDRLVGKDGYVLAFTADHGMSPRARSIDGWTIEMREVTRDIERVFDKVTPNRSVLQSNRGYYLWLDHKELRKEGITAEEIADYLADYRVEDNLSPTNKLYKRWEPRRKQRLYLAALTPQGLEEALACARRKQDG